MISPDDDGRPDRVSGWVPRVLSVAIMVIAGAWSVVPAMTGDAGPEEPVPGAPTVPTRLLTRPASVDLAEPGVGAALRRLIASLDPAASPYLVEAREAFSVGAELQTAEALLTHFRERSVAEGLVALLAPLESPLSEETLATAEAALEDSFTLQNLTARQPRRPDGGLDWRHRGPRSDPEWAWMLNRHPWFPALLSAARAEGTLAGYPSIGSLAELGLPPHAPNRFAVALDAQLRDWVLANPYPNRPTYSSAWRPLEVARRMDRGWLEAWHYLRDAPEFTSGTRLLFLASLLDHAHALEHFPSPGGNHRVTERVMLAKIAVWFPEFKDARRWVEVARDDVLRMIRDQVYPDGAYHELANHYQLIAARSFSRLDELFAATGRSAEVAALQQPLEAMYRYLAAVTRPNGTGPLNNDSDLDDNRPALRWASERFGRRDWLPPAPTSEGDLASRELPLEVYFPHAGHWVIHDRSGALLRPHWSFFDLGPLGSQHEHYDRLHLSVTIGHQDFLVDAGRYTYQPGPWRDYFKGPRSHNVVLLNGQGTRLPPRVVADPLTVVSAAGAVNLTASDAISAEDGPQDALTGLKSPESALPRRWVAKGGVAPFPGALGSDLGWHGRVVVYVEATGWVVIDDLRVFGSHEVRTLWHFHPDIEVQSTPQGLLATSQPGEAASRQQLYLHPVELSWAPPRNGDGPPSNLRWESYLGEGPPQVRGWYSPAFNVRLPSPQWEAVQRVSGPFRQAWLIAPDSANLASLSASLPEILQALPSLW